MHMLYRILVRIKRSNLSEWDALTAGEWDYAVVGLGAEAGTYEEELACELAVLEGKVVAGGLTDMAKFYDNVSLNFWPGRRRSSATRPGC